MLPNFNSNIIQRNLSIFKFRAYHKILQHKPPKAFQINPTLPFTHRQYCTNFPKHFYPYGPCIFMFNKPHKLISFADIIFDILKNVKIQVSLPKIKQIESRNEMTAIWISTPWENPEKSFSVYSAERFWGEKSML